MARKQRKHEDAGAELPELPEARPMPEEASPGGVEGADPAWRGGSSNLGEVLNPEPPGDYTYSTSDAGDVPRVDVVARFVCEKCSQAFQNVELLNVHTRTAHRPRR